FHRTRVENRQGGSSCPQDDGKSNRRRRENQAADRCSQRVEDNVFHLHARATAAGVARVSYRSALRFVLRQAGAAFYFHDLLAQQRVPLELEICGSLLHFLLQFSQKLSQIEIAASFPNNRGLDVASAQNRMQTFLHGPPDGLRGNSVFFVVFHLLRAPVFRNRHQRFHALRDCVAKERDFTVDVARRAACGLDERSLTAQKSFLVRIQNADERNLGKIESFAEEINSNENVEIRCAQSAQDFHTLNSVDVAMQITHLQSNIAQIICEIFCCSLGERRYKNALAFFYTLAAQLDRLVDLILEWLHRDFRIEKARGPNDLLDHERRARRVHIKFLGRLIGW